MIVRLIIKFSVILFSLAFFVSARAQDSFAAPATSHHTQVKLILSAATAKPGDTILAGVDLKMEPGWHTYWKNPGDAGMATEIKWQLPPRISAGEIQWPLPQKLPPIEVTTYGYENEVMLIVPLTIATNFPAGSVDLKANVAWLECKDLCIPQNQNVEAKLTIGSETKKSADATTIESWKEKVPHFDATFAVLAWWEKPANGDTRPLIIAGGPMIMTKYWNCNPVDFFPDAAGNFEVQAATENLTNWSDIYQFHIRKLVKKFSGDWPKKINGVIVIQNGWSGYDVNLTIADQSPAGEIKSSVGVPPALPNHQANLPISAAGTAALPLMLFYAFIGGLILNIMPCVLPVIALKILGFVREAGSSPRRVRALGLVYALGVLISFLVLAGIVIGVKSAGHHAGWGMQFGSPVFIVCLTTLVTLVALNLFGVFEVTPGGRALDTAGELASKHGAPGAFFNGILATTLATPCTAPFLAPALGFAFAQPPAIIVLVFLFVGLGLASPYVLLSWNPAWLKFLPKPGAWMEKFKIAMGFPMLATVVWLYFIAAGSYGSGVVWLGAFLVVVAFAAWIFGEFIQRGRRGKTVAAILVLILLGSGYGLFLEKELDWRAPVSATTAASSEKNSASGINWRPWSPAAITAAQTAGQPVLVDFTADWCLTCQVNKKTSIEIPSVEKKLKDLNVVTLTGDYTHFPENISAELLRFGRAGVPLVLVYPKNPDANPIVLPEVLTPNIVLNALEQSGK